MALSHAQAAKRALYDGLKAALPDVGVWHSAPNTDHAGNENVIVGPSDRPLTVSQDWVGLAQRDESIDLPVRIEVFRGGTDEFAAEDRAWQIAEQVAAFLATRPFARQVFEAHPDDFEQSTEPFSDGRLARLTLVVRCQARATGI